MGVAIIQEILSRNPTKQFQDAFGPKKKKDAGPAQAKKPGARASSPKSFLTSRKGGQNFGDTDTKRKTLLGVS